MKCEGFHVVCWFEWEAEQAAPSEGVMAGKDMAPISGGALYLDSYSWGARPKMRHFAPNEIVFNCRFTCSRQSGGDNPRNPMRDKGLTAENATVTAAYLMHTFSFFRNILRQ